MLCGEHMYLHSNPAPPGNWLRRPSAYLQAGFQFPEQAVHDFKAGVTDYIPEDIRQSVDTWLGLVGDN